MNAPLKIISAILLFGTFSDQVSSSFPEEISLFYKLIQAENLPVIIKKFLIPTIIFAAYFLTKLFARLNRYRVNRNLYQKAREQLIFYRYRTKYRKNFRRQAVKALNSLITGGYFLSCGFLAGGLDLAGSLSTAFIIAGNALKLYFIFVSAYYFALGAFFLSPFTRSEERIRLRAKQRIGTALSKLKVPERDMSDPENGIDQRLRKLESGPLLHGLCEIYGHRRRRLFTARWRHFKRWLTAYELREV